MLNITGVYVSLIITGVDLSLIISGVNIDNTQPAPQPQMFTGAGYVSYCNVMLLVIA